jgi:hypothetical protein
MNNKEETKMNKINEKLYNAIYNKLKDEPEKNQKIIERKIHNLYIKQVLKLIEADLNNPYNKKESTPDVIVYQNITYPREEFNYTIKKCFNDLEYQKIIDNQKLLDRFFPNEPKYTMGDFKKWKANGGGK